MAFIEVNRLVKEYKIAVRNKGILGSLKSLLVPEHVMKRAVDGIDFSIERGETVGFIGPNGAGKSTTVKMLTGILTPTSGTVVIDGLSVFRERKKVAARLGIVFGQRSQLWWDLPAIDTFELLKHIYKIPADAYKSNLEFFSEMLSLHEFIRQPVRQLSLGQKMRAEIAAALLHDPEVILFDEPTIGLDVVAKEKIREFLRQVNRLKGTTMLFTTHDMQDIEKTCERMIIIDRGKKIFDGTVGEIKNRFGGTRILAVEFTEAYDNVLLPGADLVREKDNTKWFKFAKDQTDVSSLIHALSKRYGISDITVKEPEIEEVIRDIYEGGIARVESVS